MLKPESVKKILIIKLAAIGDVMFASPLVANLKTAYPDAQVHWLADSWTKSVVSRIPGIDKLYFYDRPWLQSKTKGYIQILPLLWKLRKEQYDLAIIPHRSDLAFKLAKYARVSYKVGFSQTSSYLDKNVNYDPKKHEVERNLDLLRALDIKINSKKMIYEADNGLADQMAKKYLNRGRKYVCISPGGGKNPGLDMPLKRWPKERYLGLVNELEKSGLDTLLLGSETDKEVCDYIAKDSQVENLCCKTNLDEAAALLKHCHLYIGNDSGLLYIAAAVGAPTLGIYGPTDPALLAPIGSKNDFVAESIDCSPCYHPQATVQGDYVSCDHDQACMKQLSVKSVIDKAKGLLNE